MEDLDLAALLCTRLCHDLVGPVGALGNGVELLEDEDGADMREQALALLATSAQQASRRLRFFRLAFGALKWGDEPMDEGEARAIAAGMLEGGRTALDWPSGRLVGLTQGRGRLLLNLLLVAAECLPSGGEIRVGGAVEPPSADVLTLAAVGQGARLGEGLRDGISDQIPTRELESRVAPARLAARQAVALGGRLSCEPGEGIVTLTVRWE